MFALCFAALGLCSAGFASEVLIEAETLAVTHRKALYEGEKIPSLVVDNLCELGKLTAIRFLQWVQEHPRGVIALPTGKTPELFIKYLHYFKRHWADLQEELERYGLKGASYPETSQLRFVQLDEFFPLDTKQENSFTSFVKQYYVDFFQLKQENLLTMDGLIGPTLKKKGISAVFPEGKVDLALLSRNAASPLEEIQKRALLEAQDFCDQYERKIREWGGIGFFLGGIGPEGHIAFNLPGSSFASTTRLLPLNYEAAAASAGDLGGIDHARGKLAATIGLETICFNPDGVLILFAAGDAKAQAVANAIEKSPSTEYPATILQKMKGARFYLTKGAARLLKQRKFLDYETVEIGQIPPSFLNDSLFEIALLKKKPVLKLSFEDLEATPTGSFLASRWGDAFDAYKQKAHDSLIEHLETGMKKRSGLSIFHTGPHHDDILLGYYPLVKKDIGKNHNTFCVLTSGFNAVTSEFVRQELLRLKDRKDLLEKAIGSSYADLLKESKKSGDLLAAKKMADLFSLTDPLKLQAQMDGFLMTLDQMYPGQKDPLPLQLFKGAIRETEEDRVWASLGADASNLYHMRSKFYTGEFFTPPPTMERDAKPIQHLLEKVQPDLITVAFDPEGTGPSTHYKVLQIIAVALKNAQLKQTPEIWGYRNVWDRFSFGESNFSAPISPKELDEIHRTFLSCYETQKEAPFPSPEYDGPFSGLCQSILRQQLEQLKILLGDAFFQYPALRKAAGLVLLRSMTPEEFFSEAEDLKKRVELEL